ncbi:MULTISPECIES: DUF998 domain-containing protein [unclassified Pseudomonas]|uniref:DUF998 domain-containing protein n=1 Tax=unclassified Pseudomonas TaxID=196821 RepID=UPI00244BDAF1|nr:MULTISPECIES: DUF998 domain-containing protein [unclassified Pseudomonas]MDH0300819.1 DUF998 domain-containing protein [Pseudomonas sp. GD04091]MDH1985272.1 DUF998 domain-containing protein [Pseudomonas sp. GD03689]
MKTFDRLLLASGLLIPLWLLLGVALTALAYPGYDHLQQAMSLLGAVGAPTQQLSPWVNNFPLAVLFALFAWGLARRWRQSKLARLSALLVLLHGLGSLGTGWFACDQGCAPLEPSFSQQMHNLSGLLMFLSLTLACVLWIGLGKRLARSAGLAGWSLLCAVLSVVTVVLMAKAAQSGELFGLYQRLNYGICVLWIATLAAQSLRTPRQGGLRMAIA